jgi:excisionase family DNA binding protein
MTVGNNYADFACSQMKLITPEELADWLKVPLSWIYDRVRKTGPERLPAYDIGGRLRFSIAEIEDYLRIRSS